MGCSNCGSEDHWWRNCSRLGGGAFKGKGKGQGGGDNSNSGNTFPSWPGHGKGGKKGGGKGKGINPNIICYNIYLGNKNI